VSTNEPGAPLHDEYSHGADAFRYLGLVAPGMTNDEGMGKKIPYSNNGIY
jgi:phage terminase large subunit